MKILPMEAQSLRIDGQIITEGRTDGLTGRHDDEDSSRFSQFWERA
jgi:hypothetical protein